MRKYIVTICDDENDLNKKKPVKSRQEFTHLAISLGFDEFMGMIKYKKDDNREFYITNLYREWLKNPNLLEDMVKRFEKEDELENKLKQKINQLGLKIYYDGDFFDGKIEKRRGYVCTTISVSDKLDKFLADIRYYDNGKIEFVFEDKTFTNFDEFKNYVSECEKQELIRIDEEKQKEKECNDFYSQSSEKLLKIIKNNPNLLSDDELTQGSYVGGYDGYSMSNSARASEEAGSLPLSKWTKKKILDIITAKTKELNFVMPILKRIPFNDLKSICLYEDGWHHTSKFYNRTDFYSISSPRTIVENLIEKGII